MHLSVFDCTLGRPGASLLRPGGSEPFQMRVFLDHGPGLNP